uniref:Uncharacterized protein n=1 Tax=Setaria italica TaxID=4555 RepID=K3XNC2_SETIT
MEQTSIKNPVNGNQNKQHAPNTYIHIFQHNRADCGGLHAPFALLYLPYVFFPAVIPKGHSARIIDGLMELPQILIVEAKQLAAPATSPCLDTMMAAKVRTVKNRKLLSGKKNY